jgi:hypothetical protein
VILTETTTPALMFAVAVALEPTPVITTVGAVE